MSRVSFTEFGSAFLSVVEEQNHISRKNQRSINNSCMQALLRLAAKYEASIRSVALMVLLALSINSFENYFENKLKKLLKINFMKNDGVMQKNDLNECSTCRCWKNNYAESKVSLLKTSSTNGESGLCVGGGFDGSQTKSNETCSMWRPLIDKERIAPIFYPREFGEQ